MSLLLRHRAVGRKAWGINPSYFVMEFTVPSGEFTLPNINNTTGYDGEINFGDSDTWYPFTAYNDVAFTHTYINAGTYNVMIRGTYYGVYLYASPIVTYINKVVQWGDVDIKSLYRSFSGASKLTEVPDMSSLTGVTSTSDAFRNASSLDCDIILPNNWTVLGAYFLSYTLFKNLTLPNSLQTIDQDFARNALGIGNLTIPSGVTSIGARAFYLCSGFNGTLSVPAGVSNLPGRVFEGCSGITNVLMYPTTAPTITLNDMNLGGTSRPLHVPAGASGYDVVPWTNTSIFSSVIYDL